MHSIIKYKSNIIFKKIKHNEKTTTYITLFANDWVWATNLCA